MSTVLIIDDDTQFNLMLKSALEIKGYEVETAANGKEGKALYQNKKYDVIITDIIMPDVDGYEVILDLRRMGMSDRTIAVSGGGRTAADDYLVTAQHFDVAATFNKPIDLQALRDKVDEIIKSHS
ncbi:MAG: response regulator [Fibrobacter sp.]|jgi:DNA-binding NtrC family response regulator|uniref:response regulator transcription factor n=1 Tax=Fibrobacter sp. TaxID=35828 RepID=UPI0013D690CE|nr:response regulator [Fibrobacter sp.]MBR2074898.1 response regulator [Fibrobacter sp.]MBR2469752.1 response regulator [Fibrobacter sp.]MBR2898297.1 response regulator [Fibrobacter sp.]MBR3851793.1 response regulator [Fibrobacter sp.]